MLGFRFVLASRSQYELPMDVVQTEDGLMVIYDVPMANRGNIAAQEGVGPYLAFKPNIYTDKHSRNSELRISGVRQLCYFKV
jgi:hypothetical protein